MKKIDPKIIFSEIKKSLLVAIWFIFLTFPIMVIKVNTIHDTVKMKWINILYVGTAFFFLSMLWRYLLKKRAIKQNNKKRDSNFLLNKFFSINIKYRIIVFIIIGIILLIFPIFSNLYQINLISTALMYIMLGLGLNIIVGLGGLLNLGYVAFYAVGAYSYALLNYHFGLNFWLALPIGAFLATITGVLLALPVLRLRGDYLAIVTLAFGEIIRIILENWDDFSFGLSGIINIPRPSLFNIDFSLHGATAFIYYLMFILTALTVFTMRRLENSRIGRALIALREDEIACQAMGINTLKTKLICFAIGATWAGLAGVMFAAKTTFVSPVSFQVWESIIILCIVVLGGIGSIMGVIIASLILILLPYYLSSFEQYRMLIFGAVMVIMMIFRPGGLIDIRKRHYIFNTENGADKI